MTSVLCVVSAAPSEASGAPPRKSKREAPPPRAVWAGLVGGPLSPKAAARLEAELREVLHEEKRWAVVDAAGRPMNEVARSQAILLCRGHFDEGIRALLAQRYDTALRELDTALELFEQNLAGLRDHHLRHEALVAKASILSETKRSEAARQVLRELAALDPKEAAPNPNNQNAELVKLFEEAQGSLGSAAVLRLSGGEPTLRLRLDGRDLGEPPFAPVKLAPGRHLLSIHTPVRERIELVELRAGEDRTLQLPGEGPEERQRLRYLEEVAFRPQQSATGAEKLLRLAQAEQLLVAWLRKEGGVPHLHLARTNARGEAESIGRTPIGEGSNEALAALVSALANPRRRGGFDVSKETGVVANPSLDRALGRAQR